jgi:hypothetical protein
MKLIVGEFYKGQGLGNQLNTYASILGLARLCNMRYAFASVDRFKGHDLFELDFGVREFDYPTRKLFERRCVDQRCGHDVAATDADLIRQCKDTLESVKVEGLLAGSGYWPGGAGFLREILTLRSGVRAAVAACDKDTLIHVRGGDFLSSNSQLGRDYYQAALRRLELGIEQVAVLTDDPSHVRRLLGHDVQILSDGAQGRHDMTANHHRGGSFVLDFIELLHAKRIILSNSSFAFWGAVLNVQHARVIAPRYWAARSCGGHHWSPGDLQCKGFEYV